MISSHEGRVLVLAPFGRDAQVIADVVRALGPAHVVHTKQQLLAALQEGASAAVVTEESFTLTEGEPVHVWLRAQPPWSDFPFVVLTSKRTGRRSAGAATALQRIGNVILLERPLSPDTLHTSVEAAMRARGRQYATRAMLGELAVARDAVDQLNRDLEGRIERRTRELSEANNRLMNEVAERERAQAALLQIQKMEAIGHLTGGIAHDFNNLLHVIGTNLELLSRLDCPPPASRIVEGARRTVRRGARLTDQLLSFARNRSLVPQATDIHAAIHGMQELLATSVGSRVRIELDLTHPQPVVVMDPSQFEMSILNLAVNARDAMPSGGVIAITTREVPWDVEGQSVPGVRVTVADSGVGIPPALLERVFEPFFTTKAMGSGTGLGLAQVYGFAKQSSGRVDIDSAPEQGTRIHLTFPLATETEKQELESAEAVPVTPAQRILVVEDDDDVRQAIVDILELLGHDVRAVASGAAALAALKDAQPTLLIVDYVMPEMDGAELIRHVQDGWPTIPIILATGYADMDKVVDVLGARSILKKPFRVEALAEAVHFAVA